MKNTNSERVASHFLQDGNKKYWVQKNIYKVVTPICAINNNTGVRTWLVIVILKLNSYHFCLTSAIRQEHIILLDDNCVYHVVCLFVLRAGIR